MPKRLYFHIGHPKVASTTIQTAVENNIDTLRDQGFLVADSNFGFPEEGPLDGAPVLYVSQMLERKDEGLKEAVQRFHELGDRLGGRFDKVLVTAESLCMPEAHYLARALRHEFETHVIYYIRRQDDWMLSAWNQWGCQNGKDLSAFCEHMMEIGHPTYLRTARFWQAESHSIRIRPLHSPSLIGGGVLTDFFAAIGADVSLDDPSSANASLDLALLEVFASSDFLFDSIHDKRHARWLRRHMPEGYPVEKPALGAQLLERVRKHFEAENRELHGEFFADLDYGQLFGPHPDEAERLAKSVVQTTPEAEMDRMRRVIGLQFDLLYKMNERLKKLEG